eukprot:CAMPEP_0194303520 /NCGR_PEP_ID=MMETSP0171-20130528/1373_1 /TAXON_ID=218684 /ORGANISM="Corethron pennatum, Strain L29A3" /LENGTH=308 /DNA_ID=CAMNT_0039054445 /DNA_START=316 /DNA_END=1243 /DNA_ORIENTATION=-
MYTGCFYSGEQPDAGVFFYILKHFYPIVQRLLLLRGQIVDDDGERRIFGIETQFCQGPTRVFPRKTRVGGAPGVEIAAPEGHVVHFRAGPHVDGRRGVSGRHRSGAVVSVQHLVIDDDAGIRQGLLSDEPAHVSFQFGKFFDPAFHRDPFGRGEGRDILKIVQVRIVEAVLREGHSALLPRQLPVRAAAAVKRSAIADVEHVAVDRQVDRCELLGGRQRRQGRRRVGGAPAVEFSELRDGKILDDDALFGGEGGVVRPVRSGAGAVGGGGAWAPDTGQMPEGAPPEEWAVSPNGMGARVWKIEALRYA